MRNISVKLFLMWTSGLGGDVISRYFTHSCCHLFVCHGKAICAIWVEGNLSKIYACVFFSKIGPMVQEKVLFNDISHLALWRPS